MSSAVIDDDKDDKDDWRTPKAVYDSYNAVVGEPRYDDSGHELCPLCAKPTGMDVLNPMLQGSYGGVTTKCLDCFWGFHYRFLK